jgi:hypothetical protein
MKNAAVAQLWYENVWIVGLGSGTILIILTLIFTDAYAKIKNWIFNTNNGFKKKIAISFENTSATSIQLETIAMLELPSTSKKKYLLNRIEEMKEEMKKNPFVNLNPQLYGKVPTSGELAFLQRELNEVDDVFKVDDEYYIKETKAHKINLKINNYSEQPLKNSIIEITTPITEGLEILNRVKDYKGNPTTTKEYPKVETTDQIYIVAKVGNISHNISSDAFEEPLRMYFDPKLAGSKIILNCKLHAENLPNPFNASLEIVVV